jgi:hypothetical protein
LATGKKLTSIESLNISTDKDLSLGMKLASASLKGNKTYEAKIKESLILDLEEFEKTLYDRDDYFDFTILQSSDYTLETMKRKTRRQFAIERPDGLKEIFHNANYRKLEIIAIYQ